MKEIFDNEILTVGEKIKKIRKKLRLTQADVTKNAVTRNYLSLVENNKEKLSRHAAELIVNNINSYIEENNVCMIEISLNWLLESEDSQVNKIIDGMLRKFTTIKLSSLDINEFRKMVIYLEENIFLNYVIDDLKKVHIYSIISEIYDSENYLNEAIFFNFKATELAFMNDKDKYMDLKLKLIKIYFKKFMYNEAICSAKIAIDVYNQYKLKNTIFIKYIKLNLAFALRELQDIEGCLKVLIEIQNNYTYSLEELSEIKIVEAGCYFEKGRYIFSEKIYFNELEKNILAGHNINVSIIHRNLANIKLKNGDIKTAEKYMKLSLNIKNVDLVERANNNYYATQFYIKLNNATLVKKYFDQAFNLLLKINNKYKLSMLINKTLYYYIVNNQNSCAIQLIAKIQGCYPLINDMQAINNNITFKSKHYFN